MTWLAVHAKTSAPARTFTRHSPLNAKQLCLCDAIRKLPIVYLLTVEEASVPNISRHAAARRCELCVCCWLRMCRTARVPPRDGHLCFGASVTSNYQMRLCLSVKPPTYTQLQANKLGAYLQKCCSPGRNLPRAAWPMGSASMRSQEVPRAHSKSVHSRRS